MLSGLIVTLNEEMHVRDCIMSLQEVCTDILVVDSFSSDKTIEIAQEYGARVLQQAYAGDGPQKAFATTHAAFDWVILLDADERLSPAAIKEIRSLPLQELAPETCFSFKRDTFIGNQQIKGAWGKDIIVRMFNRNTKEFIPMADHSRVVDKGELETTSIQPLKGTIIHYGFKDSLHLATKSLWLCGRESKSKKNVSMGSAISHAIAAFIRMYFLRLGFRDGLNGLTIAMTSSYYTYLKYAAAFERERSK